MGTDVFDRVLEGLYSADTEYSSVHILLAFPDPKSFIPKEHKFKKPN